MTKDKSVELKENELKNISGGVNDGDQKYQIGSIFYKEIGPDFYSYFLVVNYDYYYGYKKYICEKYNVDKLVCCSIKCDAFFDLYESDLDKMIRSSYIPYLDNSL